MYTLLQINSVITGSTGMIMKEIDKYAKKSGMRSYMASAKNYSSRKDYPENHISIGTILEKRVHRFLAKLTGYEGHFSYFATKRFLRKVDKIKPDIIHLHNLHLNYINLKLLFLYLKNHPKINVIWTLHDCWAYTGHCPYYEMVGCDRWKHGCDNCKIYRKYPESYVDNSRVMYEKKKTYFTGLENMTLITPSLWINGEVGQSFLRDYPAVVINNGIDTDVFQKRNTTFRKEYHLEDKFIILGSAYNWSERKGFDAFVSLSEKLDEEYRIVLVGNMDYEQDVKCSTHGIIHLPLTSSKEVLAEYYSAGDVFFNPTREEMFGLVNIEAQACGTPVITFRSGGSPECVGEECGFVIEKDDLTRAVECIKEIRENKSFYTYEKMRNWVERFSSEHVYSQYIRLYNTVIEE